MNDLERDNHALQFEIAWRDGYADEIREILGETLEPAEAMFRIRNVMRLWDKRRDGPIREDLPPRGRDCGAAE
jgi:hypothetical protein